jgi:hypothetical protein
MLRTSAAIASLVFAFAAPAALAQTSYVVDLTSNWPPGQAYHASVSASEKAHTVVSIGGNKVQEQTQSRKVTLDADAKALDTFPHGGLRKASLTLRSLRVSLNGAPETDFLPAGTKITAESTGETEKSFTVNEAPASPEQASVLKLVIALDSEKHSDQILFGPKKPVAVGETWTPDQALIQKTLGKDLGKIESTQATMRLDAVEGTGPARVSVVSGTVNFLGVQPALPPGVTPNPGTFKAVLDGRIPANRTASKRIENLTATADFSGEAPGPNGAKVLFTINAEAKNATVLTFP